MPEAMSKPSKKGLEPVHHLKHVHCVGPGCKDLHWVCACNQWQGSRVLNAETNRVEWREHVDEVLAAS
jgi:hypothetical protein